MATDHRPPEAPSPADALVEELIAQHLSPLVNLFPRDVLDAFAEEIRVFLYTHPVGSRMLSRTQPDERVTSGGQPTAGGVQHVPAAPGKGKVG